MINHKFIWLSFLKECHRRQFHGFLDFSLLWFSEDAVGYGMNIREIPVQFLVSSFPNNIFDERHQFSKASTIERLTIVNIKTSDLNKTRFRVNV